MPELVIGLGLEVPLEPDADAAPVLTAVQPWVAPRSSRSVRITIDGESLEPTNASREDQRRLLEPFLARQSP
jgi:hypothetical protein